MRSLIKSAVFLLVAAFHSPASADDGPPAHDDFATKWKVNDEDPMASIPSVEERNQDPLEFGYLLQDLLMRAEGAYRKQDWKNAVKYYRPLASAVPDVARSHSRLCDSYARIGEIQPAIDSCRQALGLAGAKVIDHIRFVDLLLRRQAFGAVDADDVIASLDHLREHARLHPQALPGEQPLKPAADPNAAEQPGKQVLPELTQVEPGDSESVAQLKARAREILEGNKPEPDQEAAAGALHLPTQIELSSCRLAVRIGDNARLAECMARLRDYRVPEKLLLPFQWADALHKKDDARAHALLEQARSSGVGEQIIAGMIVEQERVLGTDWSARLKSRNGMLLSLAGVVAVLGLSFFGRRRTRKQQPAAA